jgi:hypothetical protein
MPSLVFVESCLLTINIGDDSGCSPISHDMSWHG